MPLIEHRNTEHGCHLRFAVRNDWVLIDALAELFDSDRRAVT